MSTTAPTAQLGSPLDLAVIAIYVVAILAFGTLFGRHTRTTKDFFFSGQRFSAWLIAGSFVASLVGSYSFMKYSEAGYRYGLSSTSAYLNDWFILPLFMFGWLPIIYFSRVTSVPEYFERRYDRRTRVAGTVLILLYMIGYIGYNLYTLGVALEPLLGLTPMKIVVIAAVVCGIYVTAGGQTSVIMTDLAQALLLLGVGLGVFAVGVHQVGGWSAFWSALPAGHKAGLARLTEPDNFNAVGIFWQDGMANSFAFYFMNQGILMRFLAAKSPSEGRKAALWIVLLLMPLTAVAVCGPGWAGAAMKHVGLVAPDADPKRIFVTVSHLLCGPGVFGLVVAALAAALMSTVDTLINAVSAVAVNDIYRPFVRPQASDRHCLLAARVVSIAAAAIGVGLVPLFLGFDSLYTAHAAFTAAITPPLVIVILLGIVWRRFSGAAAITTIAVGSLAILASFRWPGLIDPIGHGITGRKGYAFMRAFYGLLVCGTVACITGVLFRPGAASRISGLTIWTLNAARRTFKGSDDIKEPDGRTVTLRPVDNESSSESAELHPDDLARLGAENGDLLYLCDPRWWLGGLRSLHAHAKADPSIPRGSVRLPARSAESGRLRQGHPVKVELML